MFGLEDKVNIFNCFLFVSRKGRFGNSFVYFNEASDKCFAVELNFKMILRDIEQYLVSPYPWSLSLFLITPQFQFPSMLQCFERLIKIPG